MTMAQQVIMRKLGIAKLERAIAIRDEALHLHLIAQEDVQREKTKVLVEALEAITKESPRDKLRLPYAINVVEIAEKALASVKDDKGGR